MTHFDQQNELDPLDRALAAMREMPLPDGPPPQVVASTLEALKLATQPPDVVRLSERKRKMFRLMRYSSLTAAAAVVAVLAAWLVLSDRTAPLAFGDVVNNVSKAKSVTFVLRSQYGSQPAIVQKFYMRDNAFRMEMPSAGQGFPAPAGAPPVLMALIANGDEREVLELDFAGKSAKKRRVDAGQWNQMAQADVIAQFRGLTEKDAEQLADEELNGRKVQVYQLKKIDFFGGKGVVEAGESAKVWVDPESALPVRIELVSLSADRRDTSRMTFDQFTWNEPLYEGLFELAVPEGFTLKASQDN